ncbi:MAG TPA: ABC transporter substrate-binding protein, partial [Vicinamibacterales bacterium]|nr:ABC transporter substrate-binding protein [Vicinamibacterales bacterium]
SPGSLLALVTLAVLTMACSATREVPAVARERVRVAAMPYLTHMPFHIAKAEGYFDEQGLDVDFVMLGRNEDVMSTLAQGHVDAMAGMLTLNELSLMQAGAHIRVVAAFAAPPPADLGCTQVGFLIRRDHLESGAAADPERLRAMRFDTSPFIPLTYALDELLRTAGLSIDDVELVDLPSPAGLEAMQSGQTDVVAESEPFISMHLAAGAAAVWKPVFDVVPDYVPSVMLFGPTLVDERPRVGERFMTAILKAVRQLRLGKTARNLAIVEQASGLSAEQVAGACWPTPTEEARVDPADFRGYQDWLVRRAVLDHVVPDDDLLDARFVNFANAELAR